MIPMTRTSTRAVTLGDYLIHDTIAQPRTLASEEFPLATACHFSEVRLDMILNPDGRPLLITCAYCLNELRVTDRMRDYINAEPHELEAVRLRHQEERKHRAKPLGPIRARWTFIRVLTEAGLR